MKPPIFVLGCQRSGTSLMRRILDSHPNIACPPESTFFVQFARMYEIGRARSGLETMGFTEADILKQMKKFTCYFFENYMKRKGKIRWADKTAPYLNHANTIDKMMDKEVVYVGIVRHGLDVAYSLVHSSLQTHMVCKTENIDEATAAIRFWKMQNEKLVEFKEKVGDRLYLVKYEDVTKNPEKTLKKLFDFLDEEWCSKVIDIYSTKHDQGFEDPKIDTYKKIERNSENYKKWGIPVQNHLWHQAYSMLTHFGYLRTLEV